MSDEFPDISEELLRKLTRKLRKPESADDELRQLARRAMLAQTETKFQSREGLIERLNALRSSLFNEIDFAEGDIVQWKDSLRNRALPRYGEPVIVIKMLLEPVFGDDDSGTPQFQEPLDVILGWLDKDGDMVCFHYDSRRFRKYMGTS